MITPSPLVRPLKILAGVLGLAILVLFLLWVRTMPPAMAAPDPATPAPVPRIVPDPEVGGIPAGSVVVKHPPADGPRARSVADLPAVLFGTVASADGAAIREGVLWLYCRDETVGTMVVRDGTYTFAGLREGPHQLRSRILGELPLDREVEVHAPATRLDLVLPRRWRLAVDLVTPAGEPLLPALAKENLRMFLRGITAAAFREPPAGDLPLSELAEVDAGIGRFDGEPLPFRQTGEKPLPPQTLGMLTVPPDTPVHVALLMRGHILAWQQAQPGLASVTFTLGTAEFFGHTGTVRLRLIDPDGAPITGGRVAINDAQTGGGAEPVDGEGRATLRHLQPGRLDLEIWHKELSAPWIQVDVGPGVELDLGSIVMRPGTAVEFAMAGFAGRGSISLFWLEPQPGTVGKEIIVFNDPGKNQRLKVYPGRYALVAKAGNGVEVREVDLRFAPPGPIGFDLRPGAPLRIENRVGAGRARLELHDAAGLPVHQRELTGITSHLIFLPVGTYTAKISGMGGRVTRPTIELPKTGATLTVP